LVALALAYQSPRSLFVDVGGALEGVHLQGFYEREQTEAATYRWSEGQSAMQFAGLGKPLMPVRVHLQASGGPRPSPAQVQVAANGHPLPPLVLSQSSQSYALTVDPSWIGPSGDLRLDFQVPTFNAPGDRRDLGFMVDFVRVELPTGATLPSLSVTLWLVVCSALVYLMLRGAWLAPLPSAVVVGLFLVGCAGAIAVYRLLITLYVERLATTLVLAVLVGLLTEMVLRALVRVAGWRGVRALPEWAWAGLRALVMASAALKVGGVLHPLSFIIDAPFHLRYIQYMAEGRHEYFGEALAFAVMPKDEWGSARAFIPYSPFFFVVAAPLTWLPVPLALSVPTVSAIFESLKVALVFVIGLALGRRTNEPRPEDARPALASATLYALIPATFLLQQWGNWPTQTSLWLLTLWVAFTVLSWHWITRVWVWTVCTILLALALLSYTVTAAYTGVFVGMVVLGGWVLARAEGKRWGLVALCLVAATGVALLVYYGQYVGKIIQETLPTFGQALEEQGRLTTLRPSVWAFVSDHLARAMQSYHLALVYALGFAGALWVLLGGRPTGRARPVPAEEQAGRELAMAKGASTGQRTNTGHGRVYGIITRPPRAGASSWPWQHVWLAGWLLVFPLFTLADFWMDQALKEFWYALPAVAVVGGVWLLAVLARSRGSGAFNVLFWLLLATLTWQSLSLWVFRLFFHNR
jgi:hypothetical protein